MSFKEFWKCLNIGGKVLLTGLFLFALILGICIIYMVVKSVKDGTIVYRPEVRKPYTDIYIGKIHYLKTDKGIINYTQDSIDFVNQTDTSTYK